MGHLETFSTGNCAPQRRLEFWNEMAGKAFTPQVIEPADRRNFGGELMQIALRDLVIAEVKSAPARIHHTQHHAASIRKQEFFVELQMEGCITIMQAGREARLGPGDFTLCDTRQPYEAIFDAPVTALIFLLPVGVLRRVIGYPEAITAIRMSGTDGMSGVASGFLRNLWRELKAMPGKNIAAHAGDAALSVMACAYAGLPAATTPTSAINRSRYGELVRFIEEHLTNPELGPAKISAGCKISTRYAQKVFAAEKESIGNYVLRRRLERCCQMLGSPTQRNRSITAIAMDLGFNSVAHLCTVFRKRYAMTPRQYRRRVGSPT